MTAPLYGPSPIALVDPPTFDLAHYTAFVTPWQGKKIKAKFLATIAAEVQPFVDLAATAAGLPAKFDLDFAVGDQLDAVGELVGQSRAIPTPVPNVYFSLDDPKRGLDVGYFPGPYDTPTGISSLPDDLYRRLLYAKVVANGWDGTADMAEGILATFLTSPGTIAFVDDGGLAISPALYFSLDDPKRGLDQSIWYNVLFSLDDPARGLDVGIFIDPLTPPDVLPIAGIQYTVGIAGKIPPATDLYVLDDGLLRVKAIGATVDYQVTTVDGAPLFGVDMETALISGLDVGAVGASPTKVAQMIYGG